VQVYTGNFLKGDHPHCQHGAVCLETQGYSNAVNEAGFPSVLVTPESPYRAETVHTFSW
jgi:aldose 1-epimerase